MAKLLAIAESINIMGNKTGAAMKGRDPGPIQKMAKEESAAGAGYLDLNIGPARKDGPELLPWIVETVQAVTDTPLCLDTTNTDMEKLIPIAAEHGCQVIALLWGPDGMPRDSNERAAMAVDLMMALAEAGIPNEKMLFDPIATPITLGTEQIKSALEFMSMLKDIAPGAGSTAGLSNVSNGVADNLRPYLDRTYLIMLMKYGISTAILNVYDTELMAIANGERQNLIDLVYGMMDGNDPDPSALSGSELEHYKTYRVLSGQTLFSESWLEL